MKQGNLLIVHGGAPTAVINSSLYGAVTEAKKHPEVEKVLGAVGGTGGMLKENFCDLSAVPEERLKLLLQTPASAIGTSRDALEAQHYAAMAEICRKHNIRWVLFNGGNGSMDACGKLYKACVAAGVDVRVVGIPKTVDNDIAVTDHAPGFGSAARFIAGITSEISQDVRSLPIHVSVIEAMGRNAGWVTAASALARTGSGDGPDLIYLPERPFNEEEFLQRVSDLHRKKGGVVVVASEGLCNPDGSSIVPPIFKVGRSVYYGDVSAHLANLVIQKLGIKARSEKPGISNRSSIAFQSETDRDEAVLVGAEAARAALAGENGVMVGLRRLPGAVYKVETFLIPVEQVMLHERKMPDEYISADGCDVTDAFVEWCRPLIGSELRQFVSFKPNL